MNIMAIAPIFNLLVFSLLTASLIWINRQPIWKLSSSLSKKVFLGLLLGVVFGTALQAIYGVNSPIIKATLAWIDIVGSGYVRLLQMIIMPLVFVSILSAVARLHNAPSLGKISVLTIGGLLFTTMIAALIGIIVANMFELNVEGMFQGDRETERLNRILSADYMGKITTQSVPQMLLSFIPRNPFHELTGASPTSIISVVIFAVFLGVASLHLYRDESEKGRRVLSLIDTLQSWVMKLVRLVMRLTPYGVFALMTKMTANSNLSEIINLGRFVVASYIGLGFIFIMHGILVATLGIHPVRFFQKISPALAFAFTSRSSAATIPLSIEAQTRRLGIPETIAGFAASFGATIGQNGCAGLYPAMLAVMIAPTVGINPLDPLWIATLVGVVTLSSAGVAGVGGGATFAALIVLPAMGLPITLVALLISIEPLIDMGRTAANVSGSITVATLTSQILGQTNKEIFHQTEDTTDSIP